MSADDILVLLTWAVRLSGYDMPATVPPIVVEPPAYFRDGVVGTVSGGVIHISRNAVTPDSWLVHELTHFLQPADMPLCAREREAYRVQNDYLLATGQIGHYNAPNCSAKE